MPRNGCKQAITLIEAGRPPRTFPVKSVMAIYRQLSDLCTDFGKAANRCEQIRARLDNSSFGAHPCAHIVESLFLANLSFPS